MWKFIKEEIENLNNDFIETVNYLLLKGIEKRYLKELGKIFNRYYQNLSLINELIGFAKIFLDLATTFHKDIDYNNLHKIDNTVFDLLEFFYEDLTNFFYVVFVTQEAQNINYLTDSFKSSIVQLKITLRVQEEIEDEVELEFF